MKVESVRYLYRDRELKALLRIMGLSVPQLETTFDTTEEEDFRLLKAADLCEKRNGEAVIERITAFLLRTVCEAEEYEIAVGEQTYIGLFVGTYATVVLERKDFRWEVSPFETKAIAKPVYRKACKAAGRAATLYQKNKGEPVRCKHSELAAEKEE